MKLALLAVATSLAGCFWMMAGPSDQGITSATHRAHVGGMVFANAVIENGAENPAALVDHCVIGDPCYGRFYLAKSLRDAAHDKYAQYIALRATVDGTAMPDGDFKMEAWDSTYGFILSGRENDPTGTQWLQIEWFLKKVGRQLSPGDHAVDLAVLVVHDGAAVGSPIATGRIKLTMPPDGQDIITRMLHVGRDNESQTASEQPAAQGEAASSEASEAGPVSFNLDAGACSKNWDYILKDGAGNAQSGMASNNQELSAPPPATLCLSENHNDCASNTVRITAQTKSVVVSASCRHLESE